MIDAVESEKQGFVFERKQKRSRGTKMHKLFSMAVFCVSICTGAAAFAQETAQTPVVDVTLHGAFDKLIADSKSQMMRDPNEAMRHAESAENLVRGAARFSNRDEAIATAMWLRGESLVRSGRPEDGSAVIADALTLLGEEGLNTKLGGDLLLAQGRVAGRLSDTKTAAASFFNAHDVFVALNESRSEAMSLQAIGSIYRDAESYDQALEYYERAAEVYSDDRSLDLSSFNNQANILKELGRFQKSRGLYSEALKIAVAIDSNVLRARILTNVADMEVLAGNYQYAEDTAAKALALLEGEDGTEWGRFVFGVQAHAKLKQNDFEAAEMLIRNAFEGVEVAHTSLSYEEMHDVAYQVYLERGNYEEAVEHHQSFKRLSDDAKKVSSSANLALLGARFQTAEHRLNIERLENDKLHQDMLLEEAYRQHAIQIAVIAFGGVIVLFFFIAAVSTRRNRNHITGINDQLSETVERLNDEIKQREIFQRDLVVAKDEAEQASRMKSTFLATMSHELRTPMNGILGFSKLLQTSNLTGEQREQLQVIEQSGESLLVLINDILDLSQLESGKLRLTKSPFDLRNTIEGAAKLLQAKAQEKDLTLAVYVDPGLPTIVNGDSGRVRQIAVNLLGNAVKFTEKGSIAAFVSAGECEDEIRISVTDSGIGIPDDKVDGLFERFFQVDGSSCRKFDGSGLGLAICKELADEMNGEIGVNTVPGEGSEFWITVPLPEVHDVAALRHSGTERFGEAKPVVVVSDERIQQKIFAALLPTMNLEPIIVDDGKSAIEALGMMKKNGTLAEAVIVSDKLRDMCAEDLSKHIRRNALCDDAKLVLNTARPVFPDVLASMGFDQHIDQPITADTIFANLRPATEQASVSKEITRSSEPVCEVVSLARRSSVATVLVVDDNSTNRLLMSKVLASVNVNVEIATNGAEAVKAVRDNQFDMIFMDVHMPVMDGIEATKRIRRIAGPCASTPIIALTALAMPGDQAKFLEAGMDDYMAKPIDIAALRSKVQAIMNQRRNSAVGA